MKESRFWFNPCLFNGYVYLCGYCTIKIEAFSPQTDSFIPLELNLRASYSCSLIVRDNLLLVQAFDSIYRYSAEPEGGLVLKSREELTKYADKSSNSHPVIDTARSLYYLIQQGKILACRLETGEGVQLG